MQIDALIDLFWLRNSVYNESPHEIESAKKLYYLSAVSWHILSIKYLKKKEKRNNLIIYYNIAVSTLLKYYNIIMIF